MSSVSVGNTLELESREERSHSPLDTLKEMPCTLPAAVTRLVIRMIGSYSTPPAHKPVRYAFVLAWTVLDIKVNVVVEPILPAGNNVAPDRPRVINATTFDSLVISSYELCFCRTPKPR